MKNKSVVKKFWTVGIVVGVLIGLMLAGVVAFDNTSALAQPVGEDETETPDAEDGGEVPDVPITGSALEQASVAALMYMGEGRVTDTEVGDEEGYYEIEVTLENGRQVDVHLDENFNILGQETD